MTAVSIIFRKEVRNMTPFQMSTEMRDPIFNPPLWRVVLNSVKMGPVSNSNQRVGDCERRRATFSAGAVARFKIVGWGGGQ